MCVANLLLMCCECVANVLLERERDTGIRRSIERDTERESERDSERERERDTEIRR